MTEPHSETIKLSATARKLFDRLCDGEPVSPQDLLIQCCDPMHDRSTLWWYLGEVKNQIRPFGYDIVAQSFGKYTKYRMIRPISPEHRVQAVFFNDDLEVIGT